LIKKEGKIMKRDKGTKKGISRRDFIKTASVSEGRDKFIKARKGEVIYSGGFEFNEDMIKTT
jgi:hypothetical protein